MSTSTAKRLVPSPTPAQTCSPPSSVPGRLLAPHQTIQAGPSETPSGKQRVGSERVGGLIRPAHSMLLPGCWWLWSALQSCRGPSLISHRALTTLSPPLGVSEPRGGHGPLLFLILGASPSMVGPSMLPKVLHEYSFQSNHLLATRILATNGVSRGRSMVPAEATHVDPYF